jgi:uncharacterized protein YndB with AHSA1/START domain
MANKPGVNMSKSHETIIDIKATPEEVFRAVTDPEQIVKWFAPYARVDTQVGGKYIISWDPELEGDGVISVWNPPQHFAQYSERSVAYNGEGTPVDTGTPQKIAIDYYIEALADGMTRLRLVQSGFGPEAAWDDEYQATKTGWSDFMRKLKEILEN